MKQYKIKDLYHSVSLENIHVKGKIGKLMDTFFRERVLSDFARKTIYKETEDAFRTQRDDEGVIGIWQGEYWGKWIISAVRVCKYYSDEELKNFIHQCTDAILDLQREDGYLGTYRDSLNMFSPDPAEAKKEVGWECKWNWNIWCRKYTLWGLLEAYELLDDKKILQGAVRLIDHLINELQENNINIMDTGTFSGIPSCSIMKPMLRLYQLTENERYLEFCLNIANQWDSVKKPGLIANSLAGKKIDDWYEDTLSWSKTYETLSCFDGILELYRITGISKYLEAAKCFWELLEKYEKNILFSVGYNDQFYHAGEEINALTEPCDILHYMRICYELFKMTADTKYMDSFELIYYNAFLASPCKDGKWGARTVRSSGSHEFAYFQAKMKHNHCCVNNLPRGFLNAAESAVFAGEKEVFINLYHNYEASLTVGTTTINVQTQGDYVAESAADIIISFDGEPKDIVLRIPSWSKQSLIIVDNQRDIVQERIYKISPKKDKISIRVVFDNMPYIIPFMKPIPNHTPEDWEYVRWDTYENYTKCLGRTFLNDRRCIVRKGAILLCRSKLIGNTTEEMFDCSHLIDETYSCSLEKCKTDADVMMCYIAHFVKRDDETNEVLEEYCTKVCDYAFSANFIQDDSEYYSIFF